MGEEEGDDDENETMIKKVAVSCSNRQITIKNLKLYIWYSI
jgi:hypothetical protein